MFGTTSFYRLPFKLFKHGGHTACDPISVRDIPGCSALNHLDLMNLVLGVGTPDLGAILQDWPDHREVCCGFSFLVVNSKTAA